MVDMTSLRHQTMVCSHLPAWGAPTSPVHRVTAPVVLTLTRVGAVGAVQTLRADGVTPEMGIKFELSNYSEVDDEHVAIDMTVFVCSLLSKCINDVTHSAPL